MDSCKLRYINKYLLRIMEAQFEYTDKDIDFGRTSDTPLMNFVAAIDIDKQIIRIPFTVKTTQISKLVDNYLQITSHRSKFKGRPCLRVLNGNHRKTIAEEKLSLMKLGLSLKEVCFRVEDSLNPEPDLSGVAQYIKEEDLNEMIDVTFSLQNKKTRLTLNKQLSILKVIQALVQNMNELKNSKEEIALYLEGNILLNKQNKLEQLQLTDKQVKIYKIKRVGCFKSSTKVLLADQANEKEISQLKAGDRISSFNRKTKQFEENVVVSINESIVSESIVVRLKNKLEIEATPNNLLLRSDGTFMLIKSENPLENCLKVGEHLMLNQGKPVEIISIQCKLFPPEVFYSIYTQGYSKADNGNKNIVVHGVVSHFQYIKIRSPDGQIHPIDVVPSDRIGEVKQKMEAIICLNAANQGLNACGKWLNSSQTLMDKNIANETLFHQAKILFSKQFNLFHENAVISLRDNNKKYAKVKDLKENDQLMSTDPNDFNISKDSCKVQKINAVKIDECIELLLDDISLKVCPQTYFLLHGGDIMLASEMYNIYQSNPRKFRGFELKSPGGQAQAILKMSLVKTTESFYKIQSQNLNFIVNNVIIPNSIVKFVKQPNEKDRRSFYLNISKETKVGDIKKRIEKQIEIPPESQNLWFNNQFFQRDNATLSEKYVSNESVIIVKEISKINYSSSIFLNKEQKENNASKKICFQFASKGQKYTLQYELFKDWTIKKILTQYMKTEDTSYFLMFSNTLIFSNQTLSKMETDSSFEIENNVLIIKNEKISFLAAMAIQSESIRNSSCIMFQNDSILSSIPEKSRIKVEQTENLKDLMRKASSQIQDRALSPYLKRQHFFKPFLLFTSRKYHQDIYQYIKNFEDNRTEIDKEGSLFAVIKDLYQNMSFLMNHLRLCYYGLRNFKASMFLAGGHTFYWYNFTLAYKSKTNVSEQLKGHSGTLFRIQSTSGKLISQYALNPNKNEILFAPFTYFLVERVIKGEEMDEVWLTEVASPVTFNKSIILWVDDNPLNNHLQYNTILNLMPQLEILQVTSTTAAEKWIQEFGWILNWKGVDFKLISDMGRKEVKDNVEKDNPEAGIQLLESLYVMKGYSAKTLIFCYNMEKAEQIAHRKGIPEGRYIITNKISELDEYIGINRKQE